MVLPAPGYVPIEEDGEVSKNRKILLLICVLTIVIATIISGVILTQI